MVEREGGFTIVEAATVLAIFSVIMGAVALVLMSGTKTEHDQQVRAKALSDIRLSMGRVTKDLRQATKVQTTSCTGTPSSATLCSSASRLDINTLISSAEYRVVFDVQGNTLRRATCPITTGSTCTVGTPVPLVADLTASGLFCYNPPTCDAAVPSSENPDLVRVTISARPEASSSAEPIVLSTDVNLRNPPGSSA